MIRPGVYRLGENVEINGVFYNSAGGIMYDAADIKIFLLNPSNELLGPFNSVMVGGEVSMDFELDNDSNSVGEWKARMECGYPKVAIVETKFLVAPHK